MKFYNMIRTAVLCVGCTLVLGVFVGGCSSGSDKESGHDGHQHEEGEHHEGDGHDHEGEEKESSEHGEGEEHDIHLTDAMKKTAGIEVAAVRRGAVDAGFSAPAHILATQSGEAHVGTLLAGRITRLYAEEGTAVAKGAALAEIEAFGVAELQSNYLRAVAEVERSHAELKRSETLDEARIGARRSLDEARSAWQQAVALQKSIAVQLQAVGISPEEISKGSALGSRILLRAPVAGVVSRRYVSLGEYLDVNRDAFEIVNTATVWADAQVQPERASLLRTGSEAVVRGGKGEPRTGKIIYIAPVVDSSSRMVTVRLSLDNRDNSFRPYSYATVQFLSASGRSALVVPRAALEQEGGRYFVYRQTSDDGFERMEVAVGTTTEQEAEITSGLEEGQSIAVNGVFYLKSIRKSGELAEHHH